MNNCRKCHDKNNKASNKVIYRACLKYSKVFNKTNENNR